jgi:hypothetical protein
MATAEHFIDELKTLLTRSIEGNTQLASRLSALAQHASKGGLPTDGNDLFARWLDFNLASASLVSSHSLTVLHGVLDAAERSLLGREIPVVHDGPAPGTPGTAAHGAIDVHVEGEPGETVRAPFLIANEYDRQLEVAFEASPLGTESGATIAVDRVSFEPPALALGKGQRVVQAAIAIPAEAVRGATYRGEIRVKGFQARSIALALTVRGATTSSGSGGSEVKEAGIAPKARNARRGGSAPSARSANGGTTTTRRGGKGTRPRRGST